MSCKNKKISLYLNYDKTYSILQQIVNYEQFVIIKFYILDPVFRLVKCFIKDSRIL